MTGRRFVFLGHATPQDNAFTLWLSSRLTAAGYDVWCDLKRLVGGETFWNDITVALAEHSAIYLPIVSNASVDTAKRGFHDEVALGVAVMRKESLDRFVLPLRLDPVARMPTPLIQLNYLDFSRGWAAGLRELLKALDEAKVPQKVVPEDGSMAAWRDHQASVAMAAREMPSPEVITTNWLPVASLPPRIRILGSPLPLEMWERAAKRLTVPHVLHGEHLLTFASAEHVSELLGPDVPVRPVGSVQTQQFLGGRSDKAGPQIAAPDARRIVTGMMNRAWEDLAISRGLVAQDMATTRAFRFPAGLLNGDKVRFRQPDGRRAWRQMVGRKGKLGVLWHYALSGRFELRDPRRLVLRAHVLFTQGSASVLDDRKKTHKLRRSLCSDWWNADWRDRMRAAVAHLSQDRNSLRLPIGDAWVELSAEAVSFESAASYQRGRRPDEGEADSDIDFDNRVRALEDDSDSDDEDDE